MTMKIIGITGGVGSGKSTVLRYMEEKWKTFVVSADEIGRAEQRSGNEAFLKIVESFGEKVIAADGELDRKLLAEIIYHDDEKRDLINSIVHPLVKTRILEQIRKAEKSGISYFVIESALLIEAGYVDICDELWFVFADQETRIKRLMDSRGYTRERCEQIFSSQLSDSEFMRKCSVCIDNSSETEQTCQQIDKQFLRLEEEAGYEVM